MRISIIAALGNKNQIGKDNKLLWHISDDLKNFKKLTLGHHILMGRKTYESIGIPLPGRITLIMSANQTYSAEGCTTVNSFEQAFKLAEAAGEEELFVCGGGEIYKNLLDKADRFYISQIDYDGEADTFFPDLSSQSLKVVEEKNHKKGEKSPPWVYRILERTNPKAVQ